MPHFGLMDEKKLGPTATALQRARLHIRAGKRRLRQEKFSAGIATLYDALSHAMYWYLLTHPEIDTLGNPADRAADDRQLFNRLVDAGVLENKRQYETLAHLLQEALNKKLPAGDYHGIIQEVETIMTRLGVMPFDEDRLPPENPNTY
jgi:hypothetical protein